MTSDCLRTLRLSFVIAYLSPMLLRLETFFNFCWCDGMIPCNKARMARTVAGTEDVYMIHISSDGIHVGLC